jgi:hypothetical protein
LDISLPDEFGQLCDVRLVEFYLIFDFLSSWSYQELTEDLEEESDYDLDPAVYEPTSSADVVLLGDEDWTYTGPFNPFADLDQLAVQVAEHVLSGFDDLPFGEEEDCDETDSTPSEAGETFSDLSDEALDQPQQALEGQDEVQDSSTRPHLQASLLASAAPPHADNATADESSSDMDISLESEAPPILSDNPENRSSIHEVRGSARAFDASALIEALGKLVERAESPARSACAESAEEVDLVDELKRWSWPNAAGEEATTDV